MASDRVAAISEDRLACKILIRPKKSMKKEEE